MIKKPQPMSPKQAAKLCYNMLTGRTTSIAMQEWYGLCNFILQLVSERLRINIGHIDDPSSMTIGAVTNVPFRCSGHRYMLLARLDKEVTRIQLHRDHKIMVESDFSHYRITRLIVHTDSYGLYSMRSINGAATKAFVTKLRSLMVLHGCPVMKAASKEGRGDDDYSPMRDRRPVPRTEERPHGHTVAIATKRL